MNRRLRKKHVVEAIKKQPTLVKPRKQLSNKGLSMAWDSGESLGIPGTSRRTGLMSDYDRKDTLYQSWKGCIWVSACVDVIAKRITSGGYTIEKVDETLPDNLAEYKLIDDLLLYVNDDEDFLQFVRAVITDILIFGEAYAEIVYNGKHPAQLHKVDCMSMYYHLDQHGNITKYEQQLERSLSAVTFDPGEIVRWWLPDPRASKLAISPIERILNSVDADGKMMDWNRKFFQKGAHPPFWVDLGPESTGDLEEIDRYKTQFRENYTGLGNAQVPPILWSGAKIVPFGQTALDASFIQGRKVNREEILAGYSVPPACVGIIETGNLGSGSGESQDKALQFNACDPMKQLFLEKLNYRIVQRGFGITNYRIGLRYADYRGDDTISAIQDKRIRNGTLSVNEARTEAGKMPVEGGDVHVFMTSKDIVPIQRFDDLYTEQKRTAELGLQTAQKSLQPPEPPKQETLQPEELSQESWMSAQAHDHRVLYPLERR